MMSDSTGYPPPDPGDSASSSQPDEPSGTWQRADRPAVGEPPTEGLLETAVGVFTSPTQTLRTVTGHPNVWWAITLFVVVGVLTGIASYAQPDVPQDWMRDFDGADQFGEFGQTMATIGLVLSPITTPLFGALIALVLHGMARMFKGEGTYKGMFVGAAFAYLPYSLTLPLQLLGAALGTAGVILAGMIGFGVWIWVVVLTVVAVRENYRLTTGKAVGVVLIPIAALFLLGLILVAIVVALLFGALG